MNTKYRVLLIDRGTHRERMIGEYDTIERANKIADYWVKEAGIGAVCNVYDYATGSRIVSLHHNWHGVEEVK